MDVNHNGKKDVVVKKMNLYSGITFLVYYGNTNGFNEAISISKSCDYLDY